MVFSLSVSVDGHLAVDATKARLHPKGTTSRCLHNAQGARYDRGTPLPYDLSMPGLRQRRFPLLGKGPALANLPGIGRTFQCGFITSPLLNYADLARGFWKMNVDIAVAAVVSVRRVETGLRRSKRSDLVVRVDWKMDRGRFAAAHQGSGCALTTMPVVATVESIGFCRSMAAV